MSGNLTRSDLDTLGQRIEHKIDKVEYTVNTRFDRFEVRFDETMAAIRVTLDEVADQLRAERRQQLSEIVAAVRELAERTGNNHVADRLQTLAQKFTR